MIKYSLQEDAAGQPTSANSPGGRVVRVSVTAVRPDSEAYRETTTSDSRPAGVCLVLVT